ncbi:MAG: HAMP domain-containing histidine kinase, partial [Desulfobacterales bacterium]|nr:HAMP domain-containing histidine kinase [Desulfobacterales bacterium]
SYVTNVELEKENDLLEQCKMNEEQLLKGEILLLNVQKERYYVMQIPVEEDFYDCDLAILYVNTAPFQRLISKINWIFGEVILISAVFIAFLGFYAGKQLDDSDKKMKQFFQNVSHELKTPIMSIQGYAEGIEQGLIHDTEKAARVILSESDRMTGMVNEILELSKLESGTIKADFTQTDVSQVLYECLERLEPLAKKKGIFFDIDVENLAIVFCDSDLIEKVFLNILTNALRYANETIEISLHTVKDMVIVSIADDGNGLSEEDPKHIFERFYRGKKGCSGVGLSLAKEIMEFHKGKIYLTVQPKTCFVIELPKK